MTSWIEDAEHSHISFSIRHNQISKVRGEFEEFSIRMTTPSVDDLSHCSIAVEVTPSSIDTGNIERDELLMGEGFFHIQQFERITFTAEGFQPIEEEEVTVEGTLSMMGLSVPVSLQVEYNGKLTDFDDIVRAGFSLSTQLDRKLLGITYDEQNADGKPVVGDTVWLEAEVEVMLQA